MAIPITLGVAVAVALVGGRGGRGTWLLMVGVGLVVAAWEYLN